MTTFHCGTIVRTLALARMHWTMKRRVQNAVDGFLDVRLYIDWPQRTIRNVSLWSSKEAISGMGGVPAHVKAVRIPARWGIPTSCGVYEYIGDWRTVLFGGTAQT